jgi:hypothetical protein
VSKRVLVLFLAALALAVVSSHAQCMVYGPPYATATYTRPAGTVFKYVGITFTTRNPTYLCAPPGTVASMAGNGGQCRQVVTNAGNYNCPPGTMQCLGFLARVPLTMVGGVPTMTGPHSCTWTCNCGPGAGTMVFTIDNSDNLPVELMEFSVEGTDEAEARRRQASRATQSGAR